MSEILTAKLARAERIATDVTHPAYEVITARVALAHFPPTDGDIAAALDEAGDRLALAERGDSKFDEAWEGGTR